jgi:hypothetical protein
MQPYDKASGLFGAAIGAVFVCIGLFIAIPHFGLFGVFWTLLALLMTGFNAYRAFGPQALAEENDYAGVEASTLPPPQVNVDQNDEPSPEERLRTLAKLKADGLIDEDEYYWKRDEIMREL